MTKTSKALPATVNNIAGIFDPINFEILNKSITKLAESNKALSDEEKKFAISIIDEWDQDVIKAIDDKVNEGHSIENSLDPNYRYCDGIDEEMLQNLAKQLGSKTASLFKAHIKARDAVLELQKNKPDFDTTRDLNETAGEYIDRSTRTEAEQAKYELQLAKARKKADWALYELKREMYATPEIQEVIKRIKTFQRKSTSFKNACNEKSRLAKISVTISDDSTREALKELIGFKI